VFAALTAAPTSDYDQRAAAQAACLHRPVGLGGVLGCVGPRHPKRQTSVVPLCLWYYHGGQDSRAQRDPAGTASRPQGARPNALGKHAENRDEDESG
jgi:hypothetical protein